MRLNSTLFQKNQVSRLGTTFLILLFALQSYAQSPNVLFIISDDLNTSIGPYMNINQHTPNLDRLAREGVRFERAYCQYPVCGPSRASLMSGLYPETNGVLSNNDQPGSYKVETPDLADHPSLAGFFREHGYYTARVSKIFHMGVPGGIERGDAGGDEPDSWDYAYNVMGPETLSDGKLELLSPDNLHYGSNFARMILPNGLEHTQTDYVASSQAIAILENRAAKPAENGTNKQKLKPDSPFFLAVGLVRPHVPLIAPEYCFEHYPEDEVQLPSPKVADNVPEGALRRQNEKIWGMNESQQKQTIGAYMASVRFMDEQVGRLLNTLDRLEIRDETIVVFISDHGYNLGEHACWSKVSLWEGSVRVPMIISAPGYEDNYGSTSESIVELIDLYPSLADLCNLSEQKPAILQGNSLLPIIRDHTTEASDTTAYTVSYGGNAGAVTTERWKYTRWDKQIKPNNEELYDHQNDPEEKQNLADAPAYRKVLETLRMEFDKNRNLANSALKNN
ncbi:iduronate 2-sulfatase [Catalinimonas alkaloidigena]|uniref:sulfatase n=1 Tax=Catalinimonas alkaloidigena TaxID=1075417 RepID=UPI0024068D18|nr:sulfatase [Catalinimonas alkaloidigena]MDF9796523.1 iduronate 2-sulfatase [Catalinimonas alkaloidigena]